MAVGTLRAVNNTLINTGGESQIVNGIINSRVKRMVDYYTTTGANEDATSTIKMGSTLPAGARIIDVILGSDGGLTAITTASVGDSNTPARYLSAVDVAGAASVTHMAVAGGLDYVIGINSGDNQILVTLNTGDNVVAAKVLRVEVLYAID